MRGACVVVVVSCAVLAAACKRDAHPDTTTASAATVAHAATVAKAAKLPPPGPPPPVAPLPPVSGEFVLPGSLRAEDSIDTLRKRFGTNVAAGDVPGVEDLKIHGAVLYPHDPTRRAYLYFDDEEQLRGLSIMRVYDARSRWQLPSGVRMGTTLSEVVHRNGKRIQFTDFGVDYGGTITNWNNGHLQPLPGQGRFSLGVREGAHLNYAVGGGDQVWSDASPGMGDDVIVDTLVFGFPKDAQDQSSKR